MALNRINVIASDVAVTADTDTIHPPADQIPGQNVLSLCQVFGANAQRRSWLKAQYQQRLFVFCTHPDFYRAMGFGYGPKMSQYRVDPAAFPKGPTKEHVRYLGPEDKQAIVDCYSRFADRTHGMMYNTEREMRSLFRQQEYQIV